MGDPPRRTYRIHQWRPLLFEARTVYVEEHERSLFSFYLDSDLTSCNADYGGISASRLEILEERLKDDVLAELKAFDGRYGIQLYHDE